MGPTVWESRVAFKASPLSVPSQFAALRLLHLSAVLIPFLQVLELQKAGSNGVQLRGHCWGGRQVPRPRPPQQRHDADRRGGVAEDAEELVVRRLGVVRRRRTRVRPQVRLRAGDARRLLQVPAPPQQLARPPVVLSHRRRRAGGGRAVLVLPHRRGAVTQERSLGPRNAQQEEERRRKKEGKNII
ncbi:hypothetical protein OsI_15761 [Oryza sativa Indica Group]|uniref:Uncharacterized protein n=2 Tax=Oryza TaxID=4527 RepID=A0A0E0H0A0_ORYNI|nr:hypothetical protein OsI_15761 [Oryza sativa Indica Group]KAF2933827.1 hypothetical protein DAI22_04g115700 [Oryza sativa Japonica Group]